MVTHNTLPDAVFELQRDIQELKKLILELRPVEQKEETLTVEEAAKFLGITVPTLYSKKSKGEIAAYKAPGTKKLIFKRSELLEFIEEGKQYTKLELSA